MQPDTQTAPVSKMLWGGRILSAIPVLFLVFDGVAKLIKPASVVEATVRLGYPESIVPGPGSSYSSVLSSTWFLVRLFSVRSC
jgi:hypothetical protein